MRNDPGFPKYLKICSPRQAFRLWLDFNGGNARISSDLFDIFGGTKSKLYQDWCEEQNARRVNK